MIAAVAIIENYINSGKAIPIDAKVRNVNILLWSLDQSKG